MNGKDVHTITMGGGAVAWQARCLHCMSAYLVVHREQSDEARVRYCAVCSALAVYTRIDGEQ